MSRLISLPAINGASAAAKAAGSGTSSSLVTVSALMGQPGVSADKPSTFRHREREAAVRAGEAHAS